MSECFEFDTVSPRWLVFRQPALAATLERLAAEGPGWFYTGPLGEAACRAWEGAGVPVTLEEWRRQPEAVEVVDAASFEVEGVRLFAPTLGLTGSACLFATYAAAARIGAAALATSAGVAELAAAMARIWQYRFTAGGANDFSGIDIAQWVDAAIAGGGGGAEPARDAAHTAHLNAADGRGMVVALSATQGHAWFGGRWEIPGTGVIMNGGMHGFTQGALMRHAGRWMGVSNMSPTIAVDAAGDRVALGCPGARRIPSNVALVLARHFVAGAPLQAAVSAGRFHAEEAGRVHYEAGRTTRQSLDALRRRFDAVEPQSADDYYGPLSALRAGASGDVLAAVDDREAAAYAAYA